MEGLITSKSRIGVLTLLALNPREVFYPREIAKSESLPFTAVLRELKHLSVAGLVEQLIKNGTTYYRINEHNPIYGDLKNIIIKTTGAAQIIKKQLEKVEGIKLAFIFGSYAKGKAGPESDIDLLVLLREPFDYFAELETFIDLLYDLQLESGRYLSVRPAGAEDFAAGRIQLYRNAGKEGITV